MPTYQYTCTDCGEPLEALQKFSDDPLTVCPNCGGKLRKVFSPVGIVFKGSGFYRTDSRNGSSAATSTKSTDTAASNGSSDSKATETKKAEPAAASAASSSSSDGKASKTSKTSEKAA